MTGTPVTSAVAALVVASSGIVVSTTTRIFAASTEIGPWAQVGGTATAVGALAYVAKLLADGKLVAQPVATLISDASKREERLEELVQTSHDREDALRAFLVGRGTR